MGVTNVTSNLNFAMNMALCVWLSYYEANEVAPRSQFYWDKIGSVWYTIVVIPWYDHDQEFSMGGICSRRYYDYIAKAKTAAEDIEKRGEAKLGHLQIIGKNLTREEAEDRLRSMMYWGDGHYVYNTRLTLTGGPESSATGYKLINITDLFDKVDLFTSEIPKPVLLTNNESYDEL